MGCVSSQAAAPREPLKKTDHAPLEYFAHGRLNENDTSWDSVEGNPRLMSYEKPVSLTEAIRTSKDEIRGQFQSLQNYV